MSLFKYAFDGDFNQRYDIEGLRAEARRRRRHERAQRLSQRRRFEALEDEVAELTLLCQALLCTLKEAGHLDAERLRAVMGRIDAEDGKLDGRVTRETESAKSPGRGDAPVRRKRHP